MADEGDTIGGESWLSKWISSDNRRFAGRALSHAPSFLGFLFLAYGFWGIDRTSTFPGVWALLPVSGAVLIILAGPTAWINRYVLSHKLAVWVGLLSFPLYLWHWPLLSFARIVEREVPNVTIRSAAVALSFALGWLTYTFVERPIRYGRHGKTKVAVLVSLMIGVGYVGYYTYTHDGLRFRPGIAETDSINAEFMGPLWKYMNNEVCRSKYPFEESNSYGWWFCTTNSKEKQILIILGDSYANHFYPGVIFNERLKHHTVLSIGACDPAWVEKSMLSPEANHWPCAGYRSLHQQDFINNLVVTEKSIR